LKDQADDVNDDAIPKLLRRPNRVILATTVDVVDASGRKPLWNVRCGTNNYDSCDKSGRLFAATAKSLYRADLDCKCRSGDNLPDCIGSSSNRSAIGVAYVVQVNSADHM
jgi:hypothetical protein